MKVLLISPLPKLDPPCGDVTYTESLLETPPTGVEYETYADAIARGTLRELGTRDSVREARLRREGFASALLLTVVSNLINRIRTFRWIFWEPFRFFWVKPGEYDVIHLNVFSAGFVNLSCPLVVSNAGPVRSLYTGARGYSNIRVKVAECVEVVLGRLLRVNVLSYSLPQASRVIAFTEYLKKWYVAENIIPSERIDVIPVFLPDAPLAPVKKLPRTVGFISKDFAARGGPTLLKAWSIVRQSRPDAELLIRSEMHFDEIEARSLGITVIGYISREELIQRILPSFDVFAYPTEFDGFYALIEAMSRGIAIATSNYQGIPEFVDHGKAGLISAVADAEGLAVNILKLLDPEVNARFRVAARQRFESCYASDAALPKLRAAYETACGKQDLVAI